MSRCKPDFSASKKERAQREGQRKLTRLKGEDSSLWFRIKEDGITLFSFFLLHLLHLSSSFLWLKNPRKKEYPYRSLNPLLCFAFFFGD